jgi:hypothetical protein
MPVVQAPIDRGKDRYSIAYAFRPGDNGVRFSYELPYSGNSASVKLPTVYPGARLVVVAAPSVQITGDGLLAGGRAGHEPLQPGQSCRQFNADRERCWDSASAQ